jgi:hypothetical protein
MKWREILERVERGELTAEEGIGKGDIDESGAGYFNAGNHPGICREVCNDLVSERPRFFPERLGHHHGHIGGQVAVSDADVPP